MNEDYDPYDIPDREEAQNPNTYAEFEKQQQRRRQMDIENMADLDPEDYDEWEENLRSDRNGKRSKDQCDENA